jgi:hypothetical protein
MDPMHRDRADIAPWRLAVRCCALAGLGLALGGCNAWQPATYAPPEMAFGAPQIAPQTSPLLVTSMDSDFVWDQIADVVDDYFRIEHEERVKVVGDLLTEGRLDTYPRTASTIFEPWNRDSVTPYERWEATLQSMRRQATVFVMPAQGGFVVDVQVYKFLEDMPRPESGALSLANAETLRNDDALIRLTNPVGGKEPTTGWIRLGRDAALEQVILAHIQARTGGIVTSPAHF